MPDCSSCTPTSTDYSSLHNRRPLQRAQLAADRLVRHTLVVGDRHNINAPLGTEALLIDGLYSCVMLGRQPCCLGQN
jgi:hypothetical protein